MSIAGDHLNGVGLECLTDGNIARRPFWLPRPAGPVAAWLHHSLSKSARSEGVLLCPPIGFEYAHSHRTLIHLADRLADRGYSVLRFDYPGTGSSHGDECLSSSVGEWVSTIQDALKYLASLTGSAPSVVGLRLGALLAAHAVETLPVDRFVAWAPVLQGRKFVREVAALQRVSSGQLKLPGFLEAGGFRLSAETAEHLAALDHMSGPLMISREALLVDRTDQPTGPELCDRLESQGIPVRTIAQHDFPDMMAEPQFTIVPHGLLQTIVNWFGEPRSGGASVTTERFESSCAARAAVVANGTATVEELFVVVPKSGREGLFGVLTRSLPGEGMGRATVLIPNAGAVHQVGPNRLHVELARELAMAGVDTIRFDLSNLGDSRVGSRPDENHPYPASATDDVAAICAWLDQQFSPSALTMVGLCSGAHTSFHSALELQHERLKGAVCVNPLTFRYEEGMSLSTPSHYHTTREATYYRQAVTDLARWRKLLTGRSSFRHILSFLARRTVQRATDLLRRVGQALRLVSKSRLSVDLLAIARQGRTVDFIFSATDPGPEILRREAGGTVTRLERLGATRVVIVHGADHTFSRKVYRTEAVAQAVRALHGTTLDRRVLEEAACTWEAISQTWTSLLEQTAMTSAFMSATMVDLWLHTFGRQRRTSAVIWSDRHGRDVACVLLSRGRGPFGPVTVSRTHLNASGTFAVACEHNDILCLPEHRTEVTTDLARLLRDHGSDEVALIGVRDELFEALQARWPTARWSGYRSESPFVDLRALRERNEDYLSALSRNTRSQIRRSQRAYEEAFGPPNLAIASCLEEALSWFEDLIRLHERRWQTLGEPGAFVGEAHAFHTRLIEQSFAPKDQSDLSIDIVRVRFGEEVVGYLYNLVTHGVVQFYQSGLQYHSASKLKPGLVCHAMTIEHCLARGDHEYDFLGGEPYPVQYKRSMSTASRSLYWAELPARTLKMTALDATRRLRRSWRSRNRDAGEEAIAP